MFDFSLRKQKQKDPSNVVISKHLLTLRGNETKRNYGYEPRKKTKYCKIKFYKNKITKKTFQGLFAQTIKKGFLLSLEYKNVCFWYE
jgi:hypothetical protein